MRRWCIYGLLQPVLDLLPGFLPDGLAETRLQGDIQEQIWTQGAVALSLAAVSSQKQGRGSFPPPAGRNLLL